VKKFVRVFLKGEPVRWFDFPIPEGGNFHSFIMQMRFEGYVLGEAGYIVHDEVRGAMLIQLAEGEAPIDFTKARMQ
jgi:hypothetical protein